MLRKDAYPPGERFGLTQGLWQEARQCPSPNQDRRPSKAVVDLLVIHNISLPPGEFGGPWIDDFFTNRLDPSAHPYFEDIKDLKVSSHLLIRRSGEIVQYVPFHRRAWHAGHSEFHGRCNCNDFSIGVEMEGVDDLAFADTQYQALVRVTRLLMRNYPGITPHRIAGHSEIAPSRKTDPGSAFDWGHYRQLLARELQGERDES
jgi:AmpD protein